ncbi:MAG: hypothetical protein JW925_02940 [Syntrophaceae bacterium]|nr:hypothetical protein [Syntrophaceae bacterium]
MMRNVSRILPVIFVLALFISSCATTPPPPPEPQETLSYSFSYTPTEPVAKKVGVTIGLIGNDWGKEPVTYGAGFCAKSTERLNKPDLTATRGSLPQQLVTVLQDFDKAVEKEYEAMMVRRGFNTMSFQKIDDMTYPQKQACNLVLYPEFHLSIIDQPEEVEVSEVKGQAVLKGEFILNFLEPMSREKLWMKRISVQSQPFQFKYVFNWEPIREQKGNLIGYNRNGIKWDNRAQRAAVGLTKFFEEVMKTSWNYFSPEELIILKKHSDEIRERKRF